MRERSISGCQALTTIQISDGHKRKQTQRGWIVLGAASEKDAKV